MFSIQVNAMKHYIYADNAATTELDQDAFEAMKPYLLHEFGNASQPYSFSKIVKTALKEARTTIAECIHARPDEIFFTSGGTESDNWAVKGCDVSGTVLITSSIEHHAVLRACYSMKRMGYSVLLIDPDHSAVISPARLQNMLSKDTRIVSVMLANNEIGTIEPVQELCKVAHQHGIPFHTDAVQAVGHIKVDVKELDVDLLSASAHKFHGPKGIGFLYIKKGTQMLPLLDGGGQESGLRAGTENIASIVGMAVALKNRCNSMEQTMKSITNLENSLLRKLYAMDVQFIHNGSSATRLPGIISLSFPEFEGESLLHCMDLLGICISTGSACNSGNTRISHVLRAICLPQEYAKGTIRISLGKNNTMEDVNAIASALHKIFIK